MKPLSYLREGAGWRGIVLSVVLMSWSAGAAADSGCALTDSVPANATTESGLRHLLTQCPNHAPALNNLAVILENKGNLEEAKGFYIRAIAADPSAIAPYAGLGDVLKAQNKPDEAANAYAAFLSRLDAAKAAGTAGGLAQYADLYRQRLTALRTSASFGGQLVSAERITRSLSKPPVRTRGLSLQARSEPHIDIHIRFDFDSARLRPETARQIEEIAKALATRALGDRHIVIEGHTDDRGPEAYNRDLSIRRAAAVRAALIDRGIARHRLSALGFGETRPLADNRSPAGQAQNRRVTFVNMGKR